MTKLYYTWADIECMMADITQKMATQMLRPHVVLGPSRGGLGIGTMMSHYFDIPFHGFEWQTRDGKVQNSAQLRHLLSKYNGKRIVIIDDINDTGETFKFIDDNFGRENGRIKFAALVNNKPSKTLIDYKGYEINKDEVPTWIVFPWEEWEK